MNINQLKYFSELYKIRNFSKAAENLAISQPALSLQIQKLEEEFGYLLVDRNAKPLGITEEGELFFEKAVKIIQMTEDLHQLSFEIEDEIAGTIRIGIIPTLSPYLIPLFIDKLNEVYPKLKVEIIEMVTEDILEKLTFNELDGGVLSTPVSAKNISFKPIFYEKFFLYTSDKHPLYKQEKIRIEDIETEQLWYLSEGNCFQNQVDSVCKIPTFDSGNNNFRYISNSIESLKRIVETQGGITFIPELATMNVPAEYEDLIKSFYDPAPYREISLAYLKTSGIKKLVNTFIQVMLENITSRMKEQPAYPPLNTNM